MNKIISIITVLSLFGFISQGFSCDSYVAQVSGLNIETKEFVTSGETDACHLMVTITEDFDINSGRNCPLVYEDIIFKGITVMKNCNRISDDLFNSGVTLTTKCDDNIEICLD